MTASTSSRPVAPAEPATPAGPGTPGELGTPADRADPGGVYLDLPEMAGPPAGPGTGPRRSRIWRWGFPLALLALFAAVPALVYAGIHVVLQSNDGRLIIATTDPSKPGWEAAVEPTPTAAIASVSDTGDLSSVSVLALTAEGVGSVLFIPADTRGPDQAGSQTLVTAYRTGGVEMLKASVESIIDAEIGEIEMADAVDWEELVAPVGPLDVANPDDVVFGGETMFAKGSIDVPPDQIGAYLRTRNWSENDTNRLLRHEAFWRAWLTAVEVADSPDAVPGENDSGVGRFIRTLATDQVTYHVLPVETEPLPDAYASVYVPLTDDVRSLVGEMVPFPLGAPPGSRPRIRVLDGTGELDRGIDAARALAVAGAQVDGIGNASSFDVATTQLIIAGPDHQGDAEELRAALGVGEILNSAEESDSIDVTVILGADALGAGSGSSDGAGG